MYFPYLRGKQYELLALRDLSQSIGSSEKISPIIEPVKKSTAPLERAIEALTKYLINFTIIINPSVGDFVNDNQGLISIINSTLGHYDNFQVGVIIDQSTDLTIIDGMLAKLNTKKALTLIHLDKHSDIESLIEWSKNQSIKFNIYHENIPTRRYRGLITAQTKVVLQDSFISRQKNSAYIEHQDEPFSEEHLYYKEDGNIGFSDYLTIGRDYTEGGFAPYAIAIHLTYINKKDESIRIRHFVSDSNSDTIDVAGKFGEALIKLMEFIDEKDIRTMAANEFRGYFNGQHYPGLGSLKKLSIKNHIELLIKLLSGK